MSKMHNIFWINQLLIIVMYEWQTYHLWILVPDFEYASSHFRRRQWHPTPVLLPGKSHGWRSQPGRLQSMGSRRFGHDWATSLSLFTFMHWRRKWEPLQRSCLENPRNEEAWWAAIYGIAQSRTRLSSSSSSSSTWELNPNEMMVEVGRWGGREEI